MAACVVWGSTCKIASPATGAASGGGLLFLRKCQTKRNGFRCRMRRGLIVRADSSDSECNAEECAPEKEVGQVSMEWVAEEKTKVVGTFPPMARKSGWTGYVEKDTAGQTNIYSVEPAVYVAETAFSSGSAGSSSDGSDNNLAIAAGIGLISLAAASSILLQVGKNAPPPIQTATEYSGPSLTYYVNKFKADELVQAASVPAVESTETSLQTEESPVPAPEDSPALESTPALT
nr:protein MAINTENANCE OF PSII UNDER HIGH LIGHT 1 [Ipomoea batatas]